VFGYILQGRIENQVEPNPSAFYTPGEFFSEPAGHLHKFLRNVRTTEPAALLTFQSGSRGQPVPFIKLLLEAKYPAARNEEASLLRIRIPAGARSEPHDRSGRGLVYVLEGKVETATDTNQLRTYTSGETLFQPGVGAVLTFRNVGTEPATLLLYHVGPKVN